MKPILIDWLIGRWHARQRQIDLELLWPTCKRLAASGEILERFADELGEGDPVRVDPMILAKAAFATHAFHDPAWLCLGEKEIYRQIDELE